MKLNTIIYHDKPISKLSTIWQHTVSGQYAVLNSNRTHTNTKDVISYTDDYKKASIISKPPLKVRKACKPCKVILVAAIVLQENSVATSGGAMYTIL